MQAGQPALFFIVPLTLGPVLLRSLHEETLRELWEKLPPMKAVAQPLREDEQEALLNRPDVVETIASWNVKDGVVVLNRIEQATAIGESSYQSQGLFICLLIIHSSL